ncbi:MAG: RNA polymerase sigma factor [Candidatus Dojkabacteria bacterium]|nr:RNA polymerase sigma factor [Candidatus Dojkabacteria bacterium]
MTRSARAAETTHAGSSKKEKRDANPAQDDGKNACFRECYEQYRNRIYWYIYGKITHSQDAEDMTADVFVKLYEHFDTIYQRGDRGILAWLYAVSRNASIDYLRKKGRQSRSIEDEEVDSAVRVFTDFVADAMKDDEMRMVREALSGIGEVEQEVLHLRFEEKLRFNEISEIVGKTEGACKMMMYRSLEKLRMTLEKSMRKSKPAGR